MKKLKDKIIEMVIERIFEYLEMTPEEQEKKRQLYEEKLRKIKTTEMLHSFIKKLFKAIASIAMIMLLAICISEPTAVLVSHFFSKADIFINALYDFSAKVFLFSLVATAPSITLMFFNWLYGMDNEHPEAKSTVMKFVNVTIGALYASLISAFLCAFSTGNLAPLLDQITNLLTPHIFIVMVSIVASYTMATTVSAILIGSQAKSAYIDIMNWWEKKKAITR